MVITLIIAFVLAIAAAIFALQNPALVTANFFGYTVDGSLALFVIIGLAIGFLIGVLVMTPGRIKSGLANTRHRKKIVELENSLKQQTANAAAPAPRETYAPVGTQDEGPKPV